MKPREIVENYILNPDKIYILYQSILYFLLYNLSLFG